MACVDELVRGPVASREDDRLTTAMNRGQSRIAGAVLLATALAGCGPGDGPVKYEVTGTVSFEGTPVEEGEIRVLPVDGTGTVGAGPIIDGQFTLMSEAGTKRIEIRSPKFADPERTEAFKGPGGMTMPPLRVERLPKKYNRDSILEEEVVPDGENHFVFELTK